MISVGRLISPGQIYEKDGVRKIVVRSGGPDDAPKFAAGTIFKEDGEDRVDLCELVNGKSAELLAIDLDGWTLTTAGPAR